jgi:glycosyltransferase involved in cell wall biosynthesis
MRILYATRLFSGLETSVAQRKWQPTGVPTIHKVIERLDRDADLRIVLADKGGQWRAIRDVDLKIEGLNAPVRILSARSFRGRIGNRAIRDFRHAAAIARIARSVAPDIVYVDHANVLAGALIARAGRTPVLFRVMGVYPFMRQALSRNNATARLMAWAYRSPFAFALCTEDGSGASSWLGKALATAVPRQILINGVDSAPPSFQAAALPITWPTDRVVVLFVGKLEREKGAEEFLLGFLEAAKRRPGKLAALIIGTGSLKATLQQRLAECGDTTAEVHMVERVPHAAMLALQSRADIYVSLNRLGSLSNANLEAMRVGTAMILPRTLPAVGEINPASALLPAEACCTIESPDDVEGLASAIVRLSDDNNERQRMGQSMRSAAARLIPSWEDRIEQEVAILKAVVSNAQRTS